ncbi:MAG: amidohydrolase family protein [Planctomycetes bacterium]|nr:amidohydrolase family protein [Planctomycetota bacterium]
MSTESRPAGRLDSHQHFWRYDPREHAWITPAMSVLRRDFGPLDLQEELAGSGFSSCIAVQAAQSDRETTDLLRVADEHPFVQGVVGWIDLRRADVEEALKRYDDRSKLVGFRHIVQDEIDDSFLLRTDFCRGIEALGQTRYSYDILVYPRQLHAACKFVERFPEHRFVLDHIAKPPIAAPTPLVFDAWEEDIRQLAATSPHLTCKVSGLVTEARWHTWKPEDFARALGVVEDAFGRHRLLYGSDWPVCLLAARDYAQVVELVDAWTRDWSEHERDGFFGTNARTFYRIAP